MLYIYIYTYSDQTRIQQKNHWKKWWETQEPEVLELQKAFGPETLAARECHLTPDNGGPPQKQGFHQALLRETNGY